MPELTDDMRAQLQDLIDDANVSVATEVGGLSSKLALTANSGSGGGKPLADHYQRQRNHCLCDL